MLSFVLTDTEDREHILRHPLSLTIRMEERVPADDVVAEFAYTPVGELVKIKVFAEDDLIFNGVVDEQAAVFSPSGTILRVSARSLAAHLLDNEAPPQCYDHPSASLIYERHVKPYGIVWKADDDAACFGEQQVNKGMSQWTVLKNFCTACYSSFPRITAQGELRMKAPAHAETVLFADDGGIAYTQLQEEIKRCTEISRVNVKISDGDGYRYCIDNADAIRRGVRRERYLNALMEATPMTCADAMLKNGADASYEIRLTCAGRLTDVMGAEATVRNKLLGVREGLYVSGVSYRMDRTGEISTLRLKRRKNRCGYPTI